MINAMKENHSNLDVSNLADAVKTKSAEEVTKMFVDSASYILRATIDKKTGRKSSKESEKKAVNTENLWDPKKLAVDDLFSSVSYLKVTNIEGNRVTVKNQLGGSWFITKDIMEKHMWSADHYETEIKCTMTELAEILQ